MGNCVTINLLMRDFSQLSFSRQVVKLGQLARIEWQPGKMKPLMLSSCLFYLPTSFLPNTLSLWILISSVPSRKLALTSCLPRPLPPPPKPSIWVQDLSSRLSEPMAHILKIALSTLHYHFSVSSTDSKFLKGRNTLSLSYVASVSSTVPVTS